MSNIKILSFCYDSESGGAAIAASRLHNKLIEQGFESTFVNYRVEDSFRHIVKIPIYIKTLQKIYYFLFNCISKFYRTDRQGISSFSLLPTGLGRYINNFNADVVIFHWFGAESISLTEILRVRGRKIVVMHDQWFVGGVNHLSDDYSVFKPNPPFFFNYLENKVHAKKLELVNSNVEFISPSVWLKDLFLNFYTNTNTNINISVIPNIVDEYNVLDDFGNIKFSVCIGAAELTSTHKGGDLIIPFIMSMLEHADIDKNIVVFGYVPDDVINTLIDYPVTFVGNISKQQVVELYASSMVYVSLSRVDNLPNTVYESLSTGTKVNAFSVGGIPELVFSEELGSLVVVDDLESLVSKTIQSIQYPYNKKFVQRKFNMKFSPSTVWGKLLEKINES